MGMAAARALPLFFMELVSDDAPAERSACDLSDLVWASIRQQESSKREVAATSQAELFAAVTSGHYTDNTAELFDLLYSSQTHDSAHPRFPPTSMIADARKRASPPRHRIREEVHAGCSKNACRCL